MPKRRWTADETKYLTEHYPTDDFEEIAKALGRTVRAIEHRANSLRLKRAKDYVVNHHFFDMWSADMAYILGITITDGCISGGRLSYGVSRKDGHLLDYIADHIVPGRKPAQYVDRSNGKVYPTTRLKVGSAVMLESLRRLGVVERKTGIESVPDVPNEFKADLLRGIFDGDGCVYIANKRTGQLGLHIVSASRTFVEDVQLKLADGVGYIIPCPNPPYRELYRWKVYKQSDIRAIASKMYYPGFSFCLERKRKRFHV